MRNKILDAFDRCVVVDVGVYNYPVAPLAEYIATRKRLNLAIDEIIARDGAGILLDPRGAPGANLLRAYFRMYDAASRRLISPVNIY